MWEVQPKLTVFIPFDVDSIFAIANTLGALSVTTAVKWERGQTFLIVSKSPSTIALVSF